MTKYLRHPECFLTHSKCTVNKMLKKNWCLLNACHILSAAKYFIGLIPFNSFYTASKIYHFIL